MLDSSLLRLAGIELPAQFGEDHSGSIIALWVEPQTAERLVMDGGEALEDLHITLRYDPDADIDKVLEQVRAIQDIIASYEPLEGVVSGFGRFYGDEVDVIYAVPDVPGLTALREAIIAALGPDPSSHGYTPHITLAYIPKDAPTPFSEPLQFWNPTQARDRFGKWTAGGGSATTFSEPQVFHLGLEHDQSRHGGSSRPLGGGAMPAYDQLSPMSLADIKAYPEPIYIRYSNGPDRDEGKQSHNFAKDTQEAGLSVWEIDRSSNHALVWSTLQYADWPSGGKPWLLTGKVIGKGHDGEPLLEPGGWRPVGRLSDSALQTTKGIRERWRPLVQARRPAAELTITDAELKQLMEEPYQFHLGLEHDQKSHAGKRALPPAHLDPVGGIRISAATGYLGGVPPFNDKKYSNRKLSPENEHLRESEVDTDRIVALRAYNRSLPETISIPDDAEVWYEGKVMTRAQMRDRIVDQFVEGAFDPGGFTYAREIDIFMGPPAAGKSTAIANKAGKGVFEIDSDRVKTHIPEFNEGKNANGVHEESAELNTRILNRALSRGIKIALPVVGKNEGSVRGYIEQAQSHGYKVNLHMVWAPQEIITQRLRTRLTSTGRFVDPTYFLGPKGQPEKGVRDKPLEVFRRLRNDPRVQSTSAWNTSFKPAKEVPAATFAEVGQGDRPGDLGGGVHDSDAREETGVGSGGLDHHGLIWEPLEYSEKPNPAPLHSIPLRFDAVTIKHGQMRILLPLSGDDSGLYDLSDLSQLEDDWTAERLRRFAEWMGYSIEPNPESELGFSVLSPSGKPLGGFVARRVVEAWQKNPDLAPGEGKAGKKKGKGGGGSKSSPEAKAAAAAEKLATAQQRAAESIEAIDPDTLEIKSKGKISSSTIKGFIAAAQAKIASATDSKTVSSALREMRLEIARYKREATKPPSLDAQLADTKQKLKANLPSATRLAGTAYDEHEIQKLIDAHTADLDSAESPEAAREAIKRLRNAVTDYKLAEQKAKRDAAAAKKAGALKSGNVPRTASEWAQWYGEQFDLEPQQYMAPGQLRAPAGSPNGGQWIKGGTTTVSDLEKAVAGKAAHKEFKNNYFGTPKSFDINAHLRGAKGLEHVSVLSKNLLAKADAASVTLPADMTVARAIHFKSGVPPEFKKGAVITDRGFTSTTFGDRDASYHAQRLQKRAKNDGGKVVVLEIILPKGTKAIPNAAEQELAIAPPSRYRITGRRGNTFEAELVVD